MIGMTALAKAIASGTPVASATFDNDALMVLLTIWGYSDPSGIIDSLITYRAWSDGAAGRYVVAQGGGRHDVYVFKA